MSVESAVIGAGFGGLAGSLFTFIVSQWRERKKEKVTKERVRALVKNELTAVRDFIQKRMLDPATSGGPTIPFGDDTIEILRGDRIIESVQYPAMSTELKIKSFNTTELLELEAVYLLIRTIKSFRSYYSETGFTHQRSNLMNWVEDIVKVIQKIDPPKQDQNLNLD